MSEYAQHSKIILVPVYLNMSGTYRDLVFGNELMSNYQRIICLKNNIWTILKIFVEIKSFMVVFVKNLGCFFI